MKKIQYYIGLFLLIWTVVSCTEDNTFGDSNDIFRIIGNLDNPSRTDYEIGDGKVKVTWAADDAIALFTDEQTSLLQYEAVAAGKQANFVPVGQSLSQQEGKEVYAFYPYTETTVSYPKMELPALSNDYSEGIPSAKSDLMYAKGKIVGNELALNFKHIFSFIKLNIKTEILKGMHGIYLQSIEPIMYIDYLVNATPYFDFKEEKIIGEKDNYLWYNIPSDVIEKQDMITCYIPVLPTTEDNYIIFYKFNKNGVSDSILEKKAPKGGFKAGYIYDLTINEVDYDIDKIRQEQYDALVSFYNATGGPQWKNNTNWCSDKPLEEWYGVEVNEAGLVENLYLGGNTFIGYIPEKITNLKQLKNLWISGDENKFSKLNADESLKNINKLKNLRQLILDNIVLDTDISKIDFSSLKNLEVFSIIGCHLYGKLPEAMKSLTKIRDLRFSNNRNFKEDGKYYGISGDISSFFPYWSCLERFEASSCMLSGSLPEISDEQGSRLTAFFVDNNAFTGGIPESHIKILDNMKKIQNDPNLGWNKFGYNISENLLSGKIPDVILNHEIFPIYLYQIMLQDYEPYVFDKTDIPWWTYKLISTDGTEYDFGKIFKNNRYTILWNLSETNMAMNKDNMEWPRKMEKLMDLYKDKGLEIYVNQSFNVTDSRMKEIMSYMPSAKLICVDNNKNNPYNKVSSFLFPNNYFSSCEDGSAYGQFFIIDSSAHLIYCGYGGGPRMKYMHGYPETNVDIFDFVTKLFK